MTLVADMELQDECVFAYISFACIAFAFFSKAILERIKGMILMGIVPAN